MTRTDTRPDRPPVHRPAGDPEPLGPAEVLVGPVVIVAIREAAPEARDAALRRLLAAITVSTAEAGAPQVVLLPGVCAGWPHGEQAIARVAAETGSTILFECVLSGWRVVDPGGSVRPWSSWQMFGSSRDADRDPGVVRRLVEAGLPGGERRVLLGGHHIGLIACGENNLLRNAQRDGNRVSVRHSAADRLFPGAGVVFNGVHTEMGNLGKIWKRFEWLSSDPPGDGPRLCLFATNNTKGAWGRTLGAWWGGTRLANGWRVLPPGAACDIRLVTDEMDQARAIVIDVEKCFSAGRWSAGGMTAPT